jgi:branched-chain amino acid transport system permease protein
VAVPVAPGASADPVGAGPGPEGAPVLVRWRDRLRIALLGATVVLFLALPWLGLDAYRMRQVVLIATLSLIVSGLNTTLGYGGELAVGQVALYAVGAYVAAWMAVHHGVDDILLCMIGAVVAVVIVGLISGIPGLRLGGWSLAMVTFFLVLLIPNVLNLTRSVTGGAEGLAGIPFPKLAWATLEIPGRGRGFYEFTIVVTAIWFALLRNLIKSPHGNAFLVLKQSPILASTLGISVYRLKLFAYVVGAIPCGIAGVLFAFLSGYISPSSFTFTFALAILTASIVGGSQSIYGAFFGAALLQLGPEQIGASFQQWALLVYGAFLLVAGILFSDGIAGLAHRLARQAHRLPFWPARDEGQTEIQVVAELDGDAAADVRAGLAGEPSAARTADVATSEALDALAGEVLTVEGATKVFGGVTALEDVHLQAHPGQITALIGPNGSGKTTLLNLVSGFVRPTAGVVRLGDTVVSGRAPYRTARLGVTRTFQTPLVPKGLTTRAFVATGRYTAHRIRIPAAVLRLPSFHRGVRADDAEAMRLLRLLGVADVADREVTSLPLGTRRLVEVARALAAEPRVFLFDEVGSGLDEDDLRRLESAMDLIRRAGGTVVLVEHNFPLVLKLADTIHVLGNGSLVASGTPDEIRTNARVLEEYAGPALRGEALADMAEPGAGDGGSRQGGGASR